MVHRPQKKRNIILLRGNVLKVYCVTLLHGNSLVRFCIRFENLDIVLQKFDRIHRISIPCKIVSVPASACADFQDAHSGFEILFNIANGCQKLDHTALRSQACVFIVCGIIVFKFIHSFHDFTSQNKNGASRLFTTCTVILPSFYDPSMHYAGVWVRQCKPSESQYRVTVLLPPAIAILLSKI